MGHQTGPDMKDLKDIQGNRVAGGNRGTVLVAVDTVESGNHMQGIEGNQCKVGRLLGTCDKE